MSKDYHKGYRLQVYIPEELKNRMDKYIEAYILYSDDEKTLTKTDIVIEALKDYFNH